jgi:hypothetical protein
VIDGQVRRAEADEGLDHFPSVAMRVCEVKENFGSCEELSVV